jgi:DNA-binding NarL/FixJ family response regulator
VASMDRMPRRVLIVDDHRTFREAARMLLTARGHTVVAEAACAHTALQAVERFAPDAVLLDVGLGGDSGFDVAPRLIAARPGLAVILTSTDECQDAARVHASGARGFVLKYRLPKTDLSELWDHPAGTS